MENVVIIEILKKEVIMPRGDNTGPQGFGPMTGRRMGDCVGNENPTSSNVNFGQGRGFERGFRRGFGRGFGFFGNQNYQKSFDKSAIENEINVLKEQILFLEKQISDSKKEK